MLLFTFFWLSSSESDSEPSDEEELDDDEKFDIFSEYFFIHDVGSSLIFLCSIFILKSFSDEKTAQLSLPLDKI